MLPRPVGSSHSTAGGWGGVEVAALEAAAPTAAPAAAVLDEPPELDLNNPSDCVTYLEELYPGAEAVALGVSPDAFEKVARFYIEDLRARTPRAPLSVR